MSVKLPSATFAASLLASAASAQVAPPPGGNLDDRVRQQVRPTTEVERTESMLTGDTDIVLLRKTPLFTLHGGLTALPTSNAYLSVSAPKSDVFFQADVGLRVGTRIADKVDVFADVGAISLRYAENRALDYSALTGAVGVSARFKPFTVSLTYQPSIVYNRDFSVRQLTQHRFRAEVALPFEVRGFQITPAVSVERALSSPADYRNWAYAGEVSVAHGLSRKVPLFAYASAGYERRDYDNYFFDFLGVERKDRLIRASVGLVWRPRAWADIRVTYSFAHNRSTSDVNGYTAHSGSLGISAQWRF